MRYRSFLIDSSRAVSVLNGEWNNKEYIVDGETIESESWSPQRFFALNGEPVIQFVHQTSNYPIYMSIPLLPKKLRNNKYYQKSENEFYYVGISGNLEKKYDFPNYFFPVAGENKIVAQEISQGFKYDLLREYSLKQGQLLLLNEWKSSDRLQSLINLDNGCYLSSNPFEKEFYFFSPGNPQTTAFSFDNLRGFLPELVTWKEYINNFSSCDNSNGRSPYIYSQVGKWDRCPVIKINTSRIKDGEFNDIFKFCGSIPKKENRWSTLLSMNNNQVIISFSPEYDFKNKRYNLDYPSFDIYKPSIIENGDKDRFCEKIKTVNIPFKVDSIVISTLDDQYLLFYGEGAVWKIKWDGSEYAKIFPR